MATTPPTPVTALPEPPDRSDRATFSARATAVFDALKNTFVSQVNALASNVYGNAQAAETASSTASTAASTASAAATSAGSNASAASTSASNAATSATSAASSATAAGTSAGNAASSAAAAAASAVDAQGVVVATNAATAKTTPADADVLPLIDSAASFTLKKISFAALKAAILGAIPPSGREKLTAARAYYVRSDGSDSNNGLANTSGGAFLTIQKAVDVAASLDLGIYDVTIYVGTGTWTAPLTLKTLVGAGKVVIRGVTADTTSTVLSTTSAPVFSGAFLGKYRLQYMKLQTTTSGDCIQGAGAGSAIEYLNVDFGSCASNHVYAGSGGFVQAVGSYSISGGAQAHFCAVDCATVVITGFTVTLTGTPTFTNAFAVVSRAAAAQSASTTYSGSATGKRYDVYSNGVLTTLGGASYLPGSVAGTTATGGVYQ